MKNKTFGDTSQEPIYLYENEQGTQQNYFNTNKYQKNGLELLEPSDRISSRALNRPLRQLFEDVEGNYEIIQTLSKIILGDKATGIIPDILEEYNPSKMVIGFFNNEPYLRIPTGALLLNLRARNEITNTIGDLNPLFINTEGNDFDLSNYITRDHNSVIVHTKPNVELYERELAQSASFDLSEQNNNININYSVDNNHNLKYKCNITRTEYDYSNNEIVTANKQILKANNTEYNNVFEITPDVLNYLNTYSDQNGFYSLEELIPLKKFNQSGKFKFVVFYQIDDNVVDDDRCVYSLSGNFGIKKVENFNENLGNAKVLKMFNIEITFNPTASTISNRAVLGTKTLILDKINRSSLDVKNLTVSNNYITVGNRTNGMTAWHLCEDIDIANMI